MVAGGVGSSPPSANLVPPSNLHVFTTSGSTSTRTLSRRHRRSLTLLLLSLVHAPVSCPMTAFFDMWVNASFSIRSQSYLQFTSSTRQTSTTISQAFGAFCAVAGDCTFRTQEPQSTRKWSSLRFHQTVSHKSLRRLELKSQYR